MTRITEAEWVQELAKLSVKSDDGMTTAEWAIKLGKGRNHTMILLKKAKAMGWLVVGRKTAEGLDGRTFTMPVYRIVRPTKK
jgi:hypothetical protein